MRLEFRRFFTFLCAAVLFAVSTTTITPALAASPPSPGAPDDPLDWVQLSTGEWLRGEIILVRDEVLEFDSEELDEVEIDWVDVAALYSPRVLSVAIRDGEVITGVTELREGTVSVADGQAVREFPAGRVHSILVGELTEANYWSATVNASLVARSGNTDQSDFTSRVDVTRETPATRLALHYRGNYGRTDGVETVNNHRGSADFNLYLSRKLFVTPLTGEVFTDSYQNIDLRTNLNAGFGYYLVRADTDWWVYAGGGYQNTRYVSVLAGEDDSVDNGTVMMGSTLETDLSDDVELDAEYSARLILGADETTLHRVFVALVFELWGDIDFDASLTWDHNTNPKPNADGVEPDKNDLITAYGLSIDF
jgi:putative salt-induced outer membrane protein YdiY